MSCFLIFKASLFFWKVTTHCCSFLFQKMKWNLPRNCHFHFSKKRMTLRFSDFRFFQFPVTNRIKWTWLSVIYSMQGIRAFESASEFRFYVGVGKYNWHCIFSICIVAGLDESAGVWWSVVNQWFLSYWFKFQPICQRLVNLADHRSLVSLQNCVISRSHLRVQNLADQPVII